MPLLDPREIKYLILHCSDSAWGNVAEIDKWHRERNFDCPDGVHFCGYHYVILNGFPSYALMKENHRLAEFDGVLEMGRASMYWGAHALGFNQRSLGICLIGVKDFTPRQMERLTALVEMLREKYGIPVEHVLGHCETELSGGKTCPNFDVGAFRKTLNPSIGENHG